MIRSEQRILTTHVGSLPRIEGMAELLMAREEGELIDEAEFEVTLDRALAVVVARQIECGIDIGNDGEMPRPNFVSYIAGRMSGFGFGGKAERPLPLDVQNFPIWYAQFTRSGRRRMNVYRFPQAVGEVRYENMEGVIGECNAFRRVLDARGDGFAEPFMTAVSPGFAATAMMNQHYQRQEDYVMALARGLKREYEHIVGAGFVLQIDAPDLAMERQGYFQELSVKQFQAAIEMHIEALNLALEDIAPEKVRLHACWGNRDGPHVYDVAMADVLPVMYQARVGAISLPFANVRHQHEMDIFAELPPPEGMLVLPGVIETTSNYVEHPLLVAERLCRIAKGLGDPTRLIAGTDCGFGTIAGDIFTAEDVVWAKLKSLRQGADIASARLLGWKGEA